MSLHQGPEYARTRRMSKFPKSLNLDLTKPLARDVEVFANLFQRAFTTIGIQSKPQADDFLLSRAQRLQHIAGNIARILSDY